MACDILNKNIVKLIYHLKPKLCRIHYIADVRLIITIAKP